MPTSENQAAVQQLASTSCQVDNLGYICQIIEREADCVGSPALQQPKKIAMGKNLQVKDADLMTGFADRGCDSLHTEWLQAQINLAIHQRAGMNQQNSHWRCDPLLK